MLWEKWGQAEEKEGRCSEQRGRTGPGPEGLVKQDLGKDWEPVTVAPGLWQQKSQEARNGWSPRTEWGMRPCPGAASSFQAGYQHLWLGGHGSGEGSPDMRLGQLCGIWAMLLAVHSGPWHLTALLRNAGPWSPATSRPDFHTGPLIFPGLGEATEGMWEVAATFWLTLKLGEVSLLWVGFKVKCPTPFCGKASGQPGWYGSAGLETSANSGRPAQQLGTTSRLLWLWVLLPQGPNSTHPYQGNVSEQPEFPSLWSSILSFSVCTGLLCKGSSTCLLLLLGFWLVDGITDPATFPGSCLASVPHLSPTHAVPPRGLCRPVLHCLHPSPRLGLRPSAFSLALTPVSLSF